MIRFILPAALLSSLVISGVWAAPVSPNVANEFRSSEIVHAGYYDKKYYKDKKPWLLQRQTEIP